MIFEITEQDIRQHFPATFAPVPGERPLCERLSHFIEGAARTVAGFIGGDGDIPEDLKQGLKELYKSAVCNIALHDAIPSLNLILTPEGFATVGNSNVVPASASRTDHILKSTKTIASNNISCMLKKLERSKKWTTETQAGIVQRCVLASGFSFFIADGAPAEWTYTEHPEMLAKSLRATEFLADHFFSRPLMAALIGEKCSRAALDGGTRLRVVVSLMNEVRRMVETGTAANYWEMVRIQDFIYSNIKKFPEFKNTPQYRAYQESPFKNEKEASAYWF